MIPHTVPYYTILYDYCAVAMSAVDHGIPIHLVRVGVCKYNLNKIEIEGRDQRKHQKKKERRTKYNKKEMLEERL